MLFSKRSSLLVLLIIYIFTSAISAESEPTVYINRLQGKILFDGMPDEAAWQICEPFPMLTHLPVFGNEPGERSDVRMLFDDYYIYIGASYYTMDPSTIMATSKKRDELKKDIDALGIIFDTYNDNENGLAFWTSPNGLRTDVAVFNDASGSSRRPPINIS